MASELEVKVKELENLPAHILGLDGWLLRTIPKEKRVDFLKGYEKLIRIVYFPDYAKSQDDKLSRERFIQAVSQAIDTLTSDPNIYDLSIEDVPTGKNPVVKLRAEVDQQLAEITKLREQILSAGSEQRDLLGTNNQLNDLLDKNQSFDRMREYVEWHLRNSRVYQMDNLNRFAISGRKINFQNKALCKSLRGFAFEEIFQDFSNERKSELLSGEVEERYAEGDRQSMVFDSGVCEQEDEILRVVGGLPYVGIKEFVQYHHLNKDYTSVNLVPRDFKKYLRGLTYDGFKGSKSKSKYLEDISPFIVPFFDLYMPVLLMKEPKTEVGKKQKLKFDLFYVEGINPHARG